MTDKIKELRKKAMSLPLQPGVYIMRNKENTIIYIGKAKALKNRVSQYFGSPVNHPAKVRKMVSQVESFDYILTDSEFEALILENSLIKQHTPKYNILLKDDKGFSYIKITKEKFPKILEAKQVLKDDARYIGPYNSGYYVKNAVDEARKIFKLPDCSRKLTGERNKERPCLNYYIKQCCGPCTGKISQREYAGYVNDAIEFLQGGSTISIKDLTEKMNTAAENLEFERAAKIRDRITAVKRMKDKQKVMETRVKEQDVIALVRDGEGGCFEVFRFKEGRLYDREYFFVTELGDVSTARGEFLERYYSSRTEIPKRITLDGNADSSDTLEMWLSEKKGARVYITVPKIGDQLSLVEMCKKNAAEHLGQSKGIAGKEASALDELASLLGLNAPPMYIESYDISNLAGTENVAGMVVFENGKPLKEAYRKFKIKTFEGQDDYQSMREVLSRRLKEYEENKESGAGFGRLPDLILLDGGKGQVSAVEPIIRKSGLNIPLFGMVKDQKHKTRAITGNGEEISITYKRKAFVLLNTIQEEVHRFAIGYHRQRRKTAAFKSSLTDIEGIGDTRAKALLKHFRTVANIKQADFEELVNAPCMNKVAAQRVFDYFHCDKTDNTKK